MPNILEVMLDPDVVRDHEARHAVVDVLVEAKVPGYFGWEGVEFVDGDRVLVLSPCGTAGSLVAFMEHESTCVATFNPTAFFQTPTGEPSWRPGLLVAGEGMLLYRQENSFHPVGKITAVVIDPR